LNQLKEGEITCNTNNAHWPSQIATPDHFHYEKPLTPDSLICDQPFFRASLASGAPPRLLLYDPQYPPPCNQHQWLQMQREQLQRQQSMYQQMQQLQSAAIAAVNAVQAQSPTMPTASSGTTISTSTSTSTSTSISSGSSSMLATQTDNQTLLPPAYSVTNKQRERDTMINDILASSIAHKPSTIRDRHAGREASDFKTKFFTVYVSTES
jgi:hypothetical protein